MTRTTRWALLAVVSALAIGAGLWSWRDRGRIETSESIAAQSPRATADETHADARDRAENPSPADDHADRHEHGEETPNVDLRAHYFETPSLRDARTFASADTALLIEASCRAHPLMAKSGSAEQRLNALYAMNPRERFPEDLFYRSLIQFWRHEGQYYQLSAIWEIGLPPMYAVKLHRSPTPDFSAGVVEQPLSGAGADDGAETMDAAAAAAYMAQLTNDYVAKGASLGLQIVEAEWPATDGKGRMRATLANGRPMSWGFPGGACVYDADAAALRCRCPSARERDAPGTS